MLVMALEPSAGRRTYAGMDAGQPRHAAAIRRLIGYLPQDFAPLPMLTGVEYVVHCARLRGDRAPRRRLVRRAEELLETVGLEHARGRKAGEYSGGMKRRLGIAQALVHRPSLLVVDEPTAGLDPEERIRFRNLVADLSGVAAVLLSTHIVEDIEATCARLCVIAGGALLFDGDPADLMRRVDGRLWELPLDAALPSGARLTARRASREHGKACSVVEADARPSGAAPHEPTLEDGYAAFLAASGHAAEVEA
jgi:ABC-type multidrug transport system ATPase subunit